MTKLLLYIHFDMEKAAELKGKGKVIAKSLCDVLVTVCTICQYVSNSLSQPINVLAKGTKGS